MGAVYLGRATDGRQVAIKVVRPELARDAGFVARFRDEVANAERVASFCTAQVLDHGEADGLAYMVTEFIDGVSLKDYVKEHGELSPSMLQGVAVGVAAALVAIHAAGLIHRDLKPANVMLSYSGPRVIDFGIARALDVASGLTMTGQLVGSPGWMAPERILQQQVTTAVDVFSWGCLVAFGKNGINPFGTGDFSVMSARLLHAEPQVGELPAPLDQLVRAALDKDPRNRPTARELLLRMVGGESSEAAVLGTLTAWQAPVPAPRGETRPMSATTREQLTPPGANAGQSPPAAYDAGPPTAYGGNPPGAHEAGPPTAYGGNPPGAHGAGPPTAYGAGPPTLHNAGPATRADSSSAGARSGSPATPSGTRPHAGSPPGGSPGRRRALLAAGTAIVLAAAGVTAWQVLGGHDDKPTAHKSVAGPAPLPSDPLVVRIDRQAGWPKTCYGSVGTLVPTTATATPLLRDAGGQCDILPRWSPDRRRIAFTRDAGGVYQLVVTDANGHGQPTVVTDRMALRNRVAWSPDGTKIAIVTKVAGVRQIAVVTLRDPRTLLQLTSGSADKDDPAWCGDRVAFWSMQSGTQQIYTVPAGAAKGPLTQVTHADHDVNDPAFSPDCRQMAYTDQPAKGARHIWITSADGQEQPRQLTSDATRDMDPTWSPNGAWIGFARGTTEQPAIWAIRVADHSERRLSPKGRAIGHPDWS
jgi:Tol biopolymer transport system component